MHFVSQAGLSAEDPDLVEEYEAIKAAQQFFREFHASPPQEQLNQAQGGQGVATAASNGAGDTPKGVEAPVGFMAAWLARARVQANEP